ncbi:hypothetical protein M0R04_09715 [Candidatus Dojkabacteria bacterium]|jgi:hypothetical protein|nr:hypothetical protein [Candidatus Dojkabacteria bacterium]
MTTKKQKIIIKTKRAEAYLYFFIGILLIIVGSSNFILSLRDILDDHLLYQFNVFFSSIILILLGVLMIAISFESVEQYEVEAIKIDN